MRVLVSLVLEKIWSKTGQSWRTQSRARRHFSVRLTRPLHPLSSSGWYQEDEMEKKRTRAESQ